MSCRDFNLGRDARPLATLTLPLAASWLTKFQSRTRCQAPGDRHHASQGLRGGSGAFFARQPLSVRKMRLPIVLVREYIRRFGFLQALEKHVESFFPSCEAACLTLAPLPASQQIFNYNKYTSSSWGMSPQPNTSTFGVQEPHKP